MQKNFSFYSKALTLGQIYDTSLNQINSYCAESVIKFGQPVMLGTKTRMTDASVSHQAEQPAVSMIETVLPWTKDAGQYVGIALRSNIAAIGSTLAPDNSVDYLTKLTTADNKYTKGAALRVLRLGTVVVMVDVVNEVSTGAYYDGKSIISAKDQPEGSIIIGKFLMEPEAGKLCVLQINNLI